MKITSIFSNKFLMNELLKAATKLDRDGFAYFHLDMLNQLAKNFQADFLTVNILHLNDKCLPDGEIVSSVANLPRSVIQSYERNLLHDDFTPITISQVGTAVFSDAVKPMDVWADQLIYKNHCTPYGHYWVLGISYRFPHHKTTLVAFDYMRSKGEPFSKELSEEFVEYISYPFYLAWLHIYGAICADTLKEWLLLCDGITQARFKVLRGIAGQGISKANILANNLDLKPRTIHRHVENTFDQLLLLQPERQEFGGNADRLASIMQAYRFMEYGAGSISRVLPTRQFDG